MDRMVATDFVIFYSFILRVVILVEFEKKFMKVMQGRFIRLRLLLKILHVDPLV
jgi:hypothetical protein